LGRTQQAASWNPDRIVLEETGYQRALREYLQDIARSTLPLWPVSPGNKSKELRLTETLPLFETERIFFNPSLRPDSVEVQRRGDLITQLINFTMASDQDSLKASGGVSTAPQVIKPMGKGARKVDSAGKPPGGGGKKKALLMGLGIVVFLAAAAAVANFFVLPIFLSDTELTEPPVVEDDMSAEETTVTPTIPTFVHTSYFDEPVTGGSVEVNVNAVNRTNITAALQQTAANRALKQEDAITEFYLTQGLNGAPIEGDDILAAMLPDVQFVADLDQDFTGFMYSDGTDVYPGYIFAFDAADLAATRTSFKNTLENSEALGNFFLANPGTPTEAGFKDGMAITGGGNSRWVAFSDGETSLDYGFKGSFAVVSTSFDGFKAALDKLGDTIPGTEVETTVPTEETATSS